MASALIALVAGPMGAIPVGASAAPPKLKGKVALPAGAAPCASTRSKPSSPTAACSGTAKRPRLGFSPMDVFSLTIDGSTEFLTPGSSVTLTATANQDVGPTPYYIEIYDSISESSVAICGSGITCSVSITQSTTGLLRYQAEIGPYSTVLLPVSQVQASTNDFDVTWTTIGLTAVSEGVIGGNNVPGETASLEGGLSYPGLAGDYPRPYHMELWDTTAQTMVAECNAGTTCHIDITQVGSTVRTYQMYVATGDTSYPPAGIALSAVPLILSWMTVSISASRNGSALTLTAHASLDVGPTPFFIEIWDLGTGQVLALCGTGSSCSSAALLRPNPDRYEAVVTADTGSWVHPTSLPRVTSGWVTF